MSNEYVETTVLQHGERLLQTCFNFEPQFDGDAMTIRLLIANDHPELRIELKRYFKEQGLQVVVAIDAEQLFESLPRIRPNMILLNINQPRNLVESNLEICRLIRQQPAYCVGRAGVIILSELAHNVIDRIVGLEVGADLYVTQPIERRELFTQIKALYRILDHNRLAPSRSFNIGEWLRIEFDQRQVYINGKAIHLTKREYDVLQYLAQPPNVARSRNDLAEHVWHEPIDDNPINRIVSSLRRKIEPTPEAPYYIKTVFGVGYKLVSAEQQASNTTIS